MKTRLRGIMASEGGCVASWHEDEVACYHGIKRRLRGIMASARRGLRGIKTRFAWNQDEVCVATRRGLRGNKTRFAWHQLRRGFFEGRRTVVFWVAWYSTWFSECKICPVISALKHRVLVCIVLFSKFYFCPNHCSVVKIGTVFIVKGIINVWTNWVIDLRDRLVIVYERPV